MIKFTVFGAPRTKKNHNVLARAGGRRVVLPSKAWTKWAKTAWFEGPAFVGLLTTMDLKITTPHNICATFYRDRNTGDAVGYYQGLADLLQKRGVISDDKWLVSWDGSWLLKDADNPRVEITLSER